MAMFMELHEGTLPLNRLNFGTIILLPKKKDAKVIQQYGPICLLNVSFKIYTKVVTNRLSTVAHKIIRPTQTAFLPGRNIMEGAVILHETICYRAGHCSCSPPAPSKSFHYLLTDMSSLALIE